jgi:hypothetical protein
MSAHASGSVPNAATHVATRIHLDDQLVEWDISSIAQVQQRAARQLGHYMRSVLEDGRQPCVGLTVVVVGNRVLINRVWLKKI